MKKQLILFGLGLFSSMAIQAQSTLAPLKVTSGFNADIVVEALPSQDHLTVGIDNDRTGFLVKGVVVPNTNDNGVPQMPATSKNGNVYNVDYSQNNALKLKGGGQAVNCPEDGTVVFASPVQTAQLWVLGISGNGQSKVAVTVNYNDGTSSDAVELTYEDWWNSSPTDSRSFVAFPGLDRINRNNGQPQGVTSVHLDEYKIDTDAAKEIVSVYIKKNSGADPNIMGFSTGEAAVAVASGFNADIVAETPDVSATANYAVDDNDWCLYEKGRGIGSYSIEKGLPEDGMITSKSGITYQVNYAALNALRMGDGSREGTLEIAGAPKCEKIYFLGSTGNGPQTLTAVITYTDETTSEGSFTYKDWYHAGNAQGDEAYGPLMRTVNYLGDFPGIDSRAEFWLYEGSVDADITKGVKSVTLKSTGGQPFVLGLSMLGEAISPWTGSVLAEGDFYLYNVESGLWLQNNNMEKVPADWTTRAQVDVDGIPFGLVAQDGGYRINPYFSGNHSVNSSNLYMDTGDAVSIWTITPAPDAPVLNAYTITCGDKKLGVTDDGFIADNILGTWQLVSKAERFGALAKATKENPVNLTWLIEGNSFPANYEKNSSWKREGDAGGFAIGGDGGGNKNRVLETWNLSHTDIYQEFEGLPNGAYVLSAAGAYTPTAGADMNLDHLNQYIAGTLGNYGWFYANGEQTQMPSTYSVYNTESVPDRTTKKLGDYYVPDGVYQISRNITDGKYKSDEIVVNVFDGKLRLGAKVVGAPTKTAWILIDNFRLTYRGSEYDQDVINAQLDKINDLLAEVGDVNTTDALQNALNTAVDAANNVDKNDPAAVDAAYNALLNAYNAAKAVNVAVLKATVELAKAEGVDTAAAEDFLANGTTVDGLNNTLFSVRSGRKLNAAHAIDVDAVVGEEPVDGGKYYLLNVGTGLFFDLTADWSTHMSIDNPGIELTFAQDGNSTVNAELPAFKISGAGWNGFNWSEEYFDKNGEHKWTFVPVEGKEKTYYMNVFDNYDWHVVYDVNDGWCDGGRRYWNALKKRNNQTYKNDLNAQWKLVTADERKALLANADETNPVDATIFVNNPNFAFVGGAGSDLERVRRGWEGIEDSEIRGWDCRAFYMIEIKTAKEVKQVIEGLPAGKYEVSANGYAKSDAKLFAATEAGNVEAALPAADADADKFPGVTMNAEDGNFDDAQEFFQTGLYKVATDVVEVGADGKLTIGVKVADYAVFDNIRLTYLGNTITLDENVDNSATIAALAAKGETSVKVVRSTVADTWNTIVLPFNLTAAQVAEAFGEGTEVAAYTTIEGDALQFTTNDGSITAATPYLIRPTKSLSADEPVVFDAVTATTDAIAQISLGGTQDYYVFTGIYDRVAPSKYDYFVAAGNTLKQNANETSKLKAFRAYFKDTRDHLPVGDDDIDNPGDVLAKRFVVNGSTNGIILENGDVVGIESVYTIAGQKVDAKSLKNGVYVVNGKKVIVK